MADIRIRCLECDSAFAFVGAPAGLSGAKPMTSVDGTELRVPIRPSYAPRTPLPMPGFHVRSIDTERKPSH